MIDAGKSSARMRGVQAASRSIKLGRRIVTASFIVVCLGGQDWSRKAK